MPEETAKALPQSPLDPFAEQAQEIVHSLESYRIEAEENRRSGMNPRDDKWSENLDLYWNRHDFSDKAAWQAQETLPEVPAAVDRFAAALKEALVASPEGFYTVKNPLDPEGDLSNAIKRMLDVWLSICGRNQTGHLIGFPAVFEEQAKMGALMACTSTVTWKDDVKYGRVAIENVDPRMVWVDHTYRNLYRIRRFEIDRSELGKFVGKRDRKGNPIYRDSEIARLLTTLELEDQRVKEERSGSGEQITSFRRTVVLDEYVATILRRNGTVLYDRAVCLVANKQFLIRGPEPIPYWHGMDWLVFAPLITVPLSPYGRTYMEDVGSLSRTLNAVTNLILDAVYASSIRSWVVAPWMLANPGQIAEGYSPGKLWQMAEGMMPADFQKALDNGTLPPEVMGMWEALKTELREGTSMNEIGLGQFAPNSRTSATEISATTQNASFITRSMAHTIETRWLDPTLDLAWKTGVQHVSTMDPALQAAAGPELFRALISRRKELIELPVSFQARGISALIEKSGKLQALLQVLQILSQNDILLQAALQEVSPPRLVKGIFRLANVDMFDFAPTERERMMREMTQPIEQAAAQTPQRPGGSASAAQGQQMGRAMNAMAG